MGKDFTIKKNFQSFQWKFKLLIGLTVYALIMSEAQAAILSDHDYKAFLGVTTNILKVVDPSKTIFLGPGNSPAPISAILTALGYEVRGMPITRISQYNDNYNDLKLLSEHFQKFLPTPEDLKGKSLVIVDFVDTRISLFTLCNYIKQYYENLKVNIRVVAIGFGAEERWYSASWNFRVSLGGNELKWRISPIYSKDPVEASKEIELKIQSPIKIPFWLVQIDSRLEQALAKRQFRDYGQYGRYAPWAATTRLGQNLASFYYFWNGGGGLGSSIGPQEYASFHAKLAVCERLLGLANNKPSPEKPNPKFPKLVDEMETRLIDNGD